MKTMEKQVKIKNDLYVLTTDAYAIDTDAERIFVPEDYYVEFEALNPTKHNMYKYNYSTYVINQEPLKSYFADMKNYYFTVEALGSGNITVTIPAAITTDFVTSLSYAVNDNDWTDVTNTNEDITFTIDNVKIGDKVQFKGIANSMATTSVAVANYLTTTVKIRPSFKWSAKGNIMSLLYGDDFRDKTELTTTFTFAYFFYEDTNLIHSKDLALPAITLTKCCYQRMFRFCSNMVDIPELPAKNVAERAYHQMFSTTGVKVTPAYNWNQVDDNGCYSMFYNAAVERAGDVTVNITKKQAIMFLYGGTKLRQSPNVKVHLIADESGAAELFYQCYDLEQAGNIEVDEIAASLGLQRMFQQCTKLKRGADISIGKITKGQNHLLAFYNECSNLEYPGNFLKPMVVEKAASYALYGMFYKTYKLKETMPLIGHSFYGDYACEMMYWPYKSDGTEQDPLMFNELEIVREINVKVAGKWCFGRYIENGIIDKQQGVIGYGNPNCPLRIIEDIHIGKIVGQFCCQQMFHALPNLEKAPTITIDEVSDTSMRKFSFMFEYCKKLKEGAKFPKKFDLQAEEMKNMYYDCESIRKIWIPASTAITAERSLQNLTHNAPKTGTVYIKEGVTISADANIPSTWTIENF